MNRQLAAALQSLTRPEPARVLAVGAVTWILTARVGLDVLGASGLWREDEHAPTRTLALGVGLAVAGFVVLMLGAALVVRRPESAAAVLAGFAAFAVPAVAGGVAGSAIGGSVSRGLQVALATALVAAVALVFKRGLERRRSAAAARRPAPRWRLAKTASPTS
jgi:hypothetical protein